MLDWQLTDLLQSVSADYQCTTQLSVEQEHTAQSIQKRCCVWREFDQLSREDASLAMNEKHGSSVVLAIRQWQYSLFERYKKH